MVSPGTLRALVSIRDREIDPIEPTVGERGEVTYPDVERHLDGVDGPATAVLESMTDRGVLESTFDAKVYCCPDCDAVGMQYATGCPDCGSVHATVEPATIHEPCGTVLGGAPGTGRGRFDDSDGARPEADDQDAADEADDQNAADEADDQDDESTTESASDTAAPGDRCPTCEESVDSNDVRTDGRYRCHVCDDWFDGPTSRLWCRECRRVKRPVDVREEALYTYELTRRGEAWIDEQLTARENLADALHARGYEATVDATVSVSDGASASAADGPATNGSDAAIVAGSGDRTVPRQTIPVHVHATDDLLDSRLVADVHDRPTGADVDRLVAGARADDATAVLVSTDGSLAPAVADRVQSAGVTVLRSSDEQLSRDYEIAEPAESTSLFDRLRAVFEPRPPSRSP